MRVIFTAIKINLSVNIKGLLQTSDFCMRNNGFNFHFLSCTMLFFLWFFLWFFFWGGGSFIFPEWGLDFSSIHPRSAMILLG